MATSSTIMTKAMLKHTLYIGLGITVIFPFNAFALNVQQSLTLPFSIEYETNPRLASTNTESVRRQTLKPSYTLTAMQGNEEFTVDVGFNIERSSNQSASADREDPSLGLAWTHAYATGQFGLTGNFSEQSTRTSEFNDTGIVANNNTRQTRSLGGNWNTELNDRYSLSINADVTKVEFGSTTGSLSDYDNKSISAQLNYSFNERLSPFARISISRFEPVNSSSTSFRSIDVGTEWLISENFSFNTSLGINETGGSNGTSGWQADINTTYETEKSQITAGLSRSRAPSGSGVIRESNQLNAGWSYSLSDKATMAVDFNYRENLGVNSNDTMLFSANYTRTLSPDWDLKLSARYRNRDNNITDVSSNALTATIIYKLPDF